MQYDRHQCILRELEEKGSVRVSELTQRFGVSIETIRRDLEYLEERGLLRRVHGGAVTAGRSALEPAYAARETAHFREKKAIGAAAADLVKDGDVIGIDVGTTTLELAKALAAGEKKIKVITNALKIALVLSENEGIEVIVLGGKARRGECSVSGFLADRSAELFRTDMYFMGVGGFSREAGFTDYHMEEAALRRLMIGRTGRLVALADHSKFGVTAMNRICGPERADVLVTDEGADEEILALLREGGTEIVSVRP
jgi:DeoR/GlpR family transcriptional regulator of sugar metabolism